MNLRKTSLRTLSLAVAALAGAASFAETVYGWTAASSASTSAPVSFIKYDLSTPTAVTTIGAFTGVASGHTLRSMDFHPTTGVLYAVSTVASPVQQYQLYTVNKINGALTSVGTPQSFSSTNSVAELEINPVTGQGHFMTRSGISQTINLATGAMIANLPSIIRPSDSITIDVLGSAFTSTGTLFVWDYNDDTVYTVDTATGTSTPLTTPASFLTFNAGGGMDISPSSGTMFSVHDEPVGGTRSDLFSVSQATGEQTLISNFGTTTFVTEIAIEPAVAAPTIAGTVNLGAYVGSATGAATVTLNYEILSPADVVLSAGTVNVTPTSGTAAYTVPAGSATGSVKVKLWGATWLKRSVATTVGATNANLSIPNGNSLNTSAFEVIDIADYAVLAAAFDAVEGDAAYSAAADLNKDAIIDIADYTILAGNFDATDE